MSRQILAFFFFFTTAAFPRFDHTCGCSSCAVGYGIVDPIGVSYGRPVAEAQFADGALVVGAENATSR
jgi:hypothetical protein